MYNEMGSFGTFGASIISRTAGRFSSVNESSVSAVSSGDSALHVRDAAIPKEIADNKYSVFIGLPP